jgi:large subunit ribosomal protein L10
MLAQEKEQSVKEMSELFSGSGAAFLLSYQGTTCEQLTSFRRELRPTGASFAIVKNTLARRALSETEASDLTAHFKGPVAVVWAKEDVVSPAKVIRKHAKEIETLSVKAGVFEGKVISKDEVEGIASLPSREELLSSLLALMNAPATQLVRLLNAPATKLVRTLDSWKSEIEKKGQDS